MLKVGQSLAHFEIVSPLGEGGMGQVYLANDTKLQRQVALKILLPEYFDSSEHLERFEREARTAAKVNHPNVVALHDIGSATAPESSDTLQYIVMEYVKGEPLDVYLRHKGNSQAEVARLAEKIAAGLAAAHKMDIVHRDIKAENIIITEEGQPKILDFGLAKPVAPLSDDRSAATKTVSQELTRAGKILGTVSYMSPEQARGEPVDARSDIFSFGILLYRMATGHLPFSGSSQVSTLARILEVAHDPPSAKVDGIPAELERIIDKCLQKDVNDRYQDARDLTVDLRGLRRQIDSGISATVSSVKGSHRKKGLLSLAGGWKTYALGLLALAVTIAIISNENNDDTGNARPGLQARQNSLAILGFTNKTGDEKLAWLETGLPEILLTDLSQSQAITIIGRERILDCFEDRRALHTHEEFVKKAQSLGATKILSGAYYRLGDKIRIDARLEDTETGQILLAEKVIGEDPFSLVDSLTDKIAQSLNIQGELTRSNRVSQFFGSSAEAFQHYQSGLEKFSLGLLDESIEDFKAAIAVDSTFALPYMRIGMSHTFQGRQQLAVPSFEKARDYQDKLPIRARSLLDVYVDLWLERDFDHAYTKMKSFVRNYPDDKEGRAIYGLLIYSFTSDSLKAFAQFDTALLLDPAYSFALDQYSAIESQYENYDRAIELTTKMLNSSPSSPDPYLRLAGLYRRQGKLDEALAQLETAAERFPGRADILSQLSSLYIHKRDFDKAESFTEKARKSQQDDPYRLIDYYSAKANVANWRGQLHKGMSYRFKALRQAHIAADSIQLFSALTVIAAYYHSYGLDDSALYYLEESSKWANQLQRISYPFALLEWMPEKASETLPLLRQEVQAMMTRLPSEFSWVVDFFEEIGQAYSANDTAALIAAYEKVIPKQSPANQRSNRRDLGYLKILTGDYHAGKELLAPFVQPSHRYYRDARNYIYMLYYIGIADQGLGNTADAQTAFSEVLKYWGDADIDLDWIQDARDRLAQLSS